MGIGRTQSIATKRLDTRSFDAAPQMELSDLALVRLMAEGDRRSLEVLYVRHYARVLRFLVRLIGSEAAAQEIVNEVFLEAWRRADRFEGRSQVATWLMAIARFRAIAEGRRRSEAPLDERAAAAIEDSADILRSCSKSASGAPSCSAASTGLRRCIGK